jgi:hypothetical protein
VEAEKGGSTTLSSPPAVHSFGDRGNFEKQLQQQPKEREKQKRKHKMINKWKPPGSVQEVAPALWYVEEYRDKRLLKRHKLERGISVLGRNNSQSGRECDIEPHDVSKVSRKHAAVYFVKGEPWLVDVGSSRGTQLLVEHQSGKVEKQKVVSLSPRRLLDSHRFQMADTKGFSFKVVRDSNNEEVVAKEAQAEKGAAEQAEKVKKEKAAKKEMEEAEAKKDAKKEEEVTVKKEAEEEEAKKAAVEKQAEAKAKKETMEQGGQEGEKRRMDPGWKKGDEVIYTDKNTKQEEKAMIVQVHREDVEPYYSIKLADREKQTTLQYLRIATDRGSKPGEGKGTSEQKKKATKLADQGEQCSGHDQHEHSPHRARGLDRGSYRDYNDRADRDGYRNDRDHIGRDRNPSNRSSYPTDRDSYRSSRDSYGTNRDHRGRAEVDRRREHGRRDNSRDRIRDRRRSRSRDRRERGSWRGTSGVGGEVEDELATSDKQNNGMAPAQVLEGSRRDGQCSSKRSRDDDGSSSEDSSDNSSSDEDSSNDGAKKGSRKEKKRAKKAKKEKKEKKKAKKAKAKKREKKEKKEKKKRMRNGARDY